MDILITRITVNPRGQTQRDQRRVSATVLMLGRATQCEIHLPDSRVALNHARLTITATGAVIESQGGQLVVNGHDTTRAELAVGDRVEIGPYLIEVETPPATLELALAVRLASNFGKGERSIRQRLRIRSPQLSVRRLSYLAFGAALLLFLVLPVLPRLLQGNGLPPATDREQLGAGVVHALSAAFTRAWNPGPLSRSHQMFGSNCESCHARPFIQVRDAECLACHKAIREHVPVAALSGPRGMVLGATRCAECHRDHKGAPMVLRAQDECASCHHDIQGVSAADGALPDPVSDFASGHPQFRLTLADPAHPDRPRRERQGGGVRIEERSNLKFNHKLHLDPAGVRDPKGKRDPAGMRDARGRGTVLTCDSCHEPDSDGRLMAPVAMERHCQGCHSLAFEPKVTTRQVPHGDAAAITTMLREFYARLALGDVPPGVTPPQDLPRVRPGAMLSAAEKQNVLRVADRKARQVLRELYDTRQVCSTCHEVTAQNDGRGWAIAPVLVTRQWMPAALFPHAGHAAQPCTTCHAVAESRVATDVAMPDIAICRECHVGIQPVHNRVASDCAMCHRFHAGRGPWHGASQKQAKRGTSR
jgi:predicted CXXCH cytochrome family protein